MSGKLKGSVNQRALPQVEERELGAAGVAASAMAHKQIYYSDKYFDEHYEYRCVSCFSLSFTPLPCRGA